MKNGPTLLASLVLAVVVQGSGSAQAWWFEDDGHSWPVFAFHEYDGSDVNRPGGTLDRPYWHGDDAVPLGMRWQDLDAARAQAAAESAAAAAVVVGVTERLPARGHQHPSRRRRVVARRPRICPPTPLAAR